MAEYGTSHYSTRWRSVIVKRTVIATGESDDPEMLERALEAYTQEKANEVLTLLITVPGNRHAVFSRACSTKNSGLFCIYLTGIQQDVPYVEYGGIIDVLFKRHCMDFERFLLANEEDLEIVMEDVDSTCFRTKEEYTRTLAAAIEVHGYLARLDGVDIELLRRSSFGFLELIVVAMSDSVRISPGLLNCSPSERVSSVRATYSSSQCHK